MKKDQVIKRFFPEPSQVFADRVEEHSKYIFPLFTIDLKEFNPEWEGEIHMLEFNEDPYNSDAVSSFNEYCDQEILGFDVINGKYSFKTDFNYFAHTPEWIECFKATKSSYRKTKEYYFAHQKLPDFLGKPGDYFEEIGGVPEWIQADATPLDPDGNAMTFIARVYTSTYSIEGDGKDLYLFYSDKHKLAVIIYQIT